MRNSIQTPIRLINAQKANDFLRLESDAIGSNIIRADLDIRRSSR